MRILVLGIDGYLGWPTALHLAYEGHEILGLDSYGKRRMEAEIGVKPLIRLPNMRERVDAWTAATANDLISHAQVDIAKDRHRLYELFDAFEPEAVVHYAEQPSAPYSMMSASHVVHTQTNNVVGTLNLIMAVLHYNPDCHIVKLGTMGEYGTPNIDIEEGWLDVGHNGRKDRVLYPKKPGSWYHASKVHDSANLEFACRCFGTRVTDLNQGVVYGTGTDHTELGEGLHTSFHYDAIFGTALNRFITQGVVGEPITVYGNGSQTRGYLNIRDTVECVRLAIDSPPERSEFRVMNQFTETFSVLDLAIAAANITGGTVEHIENPRVEQEDHYYNAVHTTLPSLGLKPHLLDEHTLRQMAEYVERYNKNVDRTKLVPDVKWNRT